MYFIWLTSETCSKYLLVLLGIEEFYQALHKYTDGPDCTQYV